MTDHQEANIWAGSSDGKEPCYIDRDGHSEDTGAAGQREYRSASTVTINCIKRMAMVRSTIASMVRRTIANVVKQEQEAHNRLGKPEKKGNEAIQIIV